MYPVAKLAQFLRGGRI